MPCFLVGDEQGYLKSLEYRHEPFADGKNYKLTTLSQRPTGQQKISVQRMAVNPDLGGAKAVRFLFYYNFLFNKRRVGHFRLLGWGSNTIHVPRR